MALVGCKRNKNNLNTFEMDNIHLKVLSEKELDQVKVYSIELSNQTDHVIVQNEVYLSYPLINMTQSKQNDLVVRGRNNKLNIKQNEKVLLDFYIPRNILNTQMIDYENPHMEIIGYSDEVTDKHRFQKSGDLKLYFQK